MRTLSSSKPQLQAALASQKAIIAAVSLNTAQSDEETDQVLKAIERLEMTLWGRAS